LQGAAAIVDEELARWGLPRVVAYTVPGPSHLTGAGVEARAHEIASWVRSQELLGPWVALDDL